MKNYFKLSCMAAAVLVVAACDLLPILQNPGSGDGNENDETGTGNSNTNTEKVWGGKPVRKISIVNTDNRAAEMEYSHTGNFESFIEFQNRPDGRILGCTYEFKDWEYLDEEPLIYRSTVAYDYSKDGEVRIVMNGSSSQDSEPCIEYDIIKLDASGRAESLWTSSTSAFLDMSSFDEVETCSYTTDGRLSQIRLNSEENSDGVRFNTMIYTYNNGMLSAYESLVNSSIYGTYYDWAFEFDESCYTNKYPNAGSLLAICWSLYLSGHDLGHLGFHAALAGCFAKKGDYLPEEIRIDAEDYKDYLPLLREGYETPNQIISNSYQIDINPESPESPDKTIITIEYNFDSDGDISKMTWKKPFEIWEYSYDIVVGNEVINREEIGEDEDGNIIYQNYYRGEIQNEAWKKVSSGYNTVEFTIEY